MRKIMGSRYFPPVAALIFVFINLPVLDIYPPVHDDEGWLACSAFSLATTGRMGCSLFAGSDVMPRLEERTYWYPPFYFVVLAVVFKTFGNSYVAARLVSLVAAAVCLFLIGLLARRIWDRGTVTFLAVVLTALDPFFIIAARTARMDMLAAAASLALLFMLIRVWRHDSSATCIFIGVFSALALSLHPVGFIPVLAGWCVVIFGLVKKRIRLGHLALLAAPQVLALALWGSYVMKDPDAFKAQFSRNCMRSHLTGLSVDSVKREAVERYWNTYGPERLPTLLLYLGGTIWFFSTRLSKRKGNDAEKILVLFGLLYILIFTFASGSKAVGHLCHLVPLMAGFGSRFLFSMWERQGRGRRFLRIGAATILVLSIAAGVGHIGRIHYLIHKGGARLEYKTFTDEIGALIPPGSRVCGSASLWFALQQKGIEHLDDPLIHPGDERIKNLDIMVVVPSYFPRNRKFSWLWSIPGEDLTERPGALQAWLEKECVLIGEVGDPEVVLGYQAKVYRIQH
ncbi:ArnT family glycosyltransferase [Acidobacteriota bacterium]